MQVWIITGGAASGKSLFCKLLGEAEGMDHFSSDAVVHQLLMQREITGAIKAKLGVEVCLKDGSINRPELRSRILESESTRLWLENLLHPLVYEALEKAILVGTKAGRKVLVAEVPLFYESQNKSRPALTVLVGARIGLTEQRIVSKRGLSSKDATGIIKAQWPLERKMALADVVVWNEGSSDLLKMQAKLLIKQLDKEHVH